MLTRWKRYLDDLGSSAAPKRLGGALGAVCVGWENVGEERKWTKAGKHTPEERELKKSDGQCLESVLLVDVKMVDHVILVSDFKGFHDEKAWNALG